MSAIMKKSIGWTAAVALASVLGTAMPAPLHAEKAQATDVKPMRITEEQAKQIALQQIKGRVLHSEVYTENGVLVYEFIIMTDQNQVYEVEVNAETGKVMKVEREDF
ncbi:PepSY domain-containing protein [Brevibacillus parabrevis]|uniref:PepSY domain-containing protein n=1 Tax=Brevibacillus parabrevis TaxID=54914 RepID=UPI0028D80D33|nr:PepSY domain-containing protein [Brevibacillus parabrevis]